MKNSYMNRGWIIRDILLFINILVMGAYLSNGVNDVMDHIMIIFVVLLMILRTIMIYLYSKLVGSNMKVLDFKSINKNASISIPKRFERDIKLYLNITNELINDLEKMCNFSKYIIDNDSYTFIKGSHNTYDVFDICNSIYKTLSVYFENIKGTGNGSGYINISYNEAKKLMEVQLTAIDTLDNIMKARRKLYLYSDEDIVDKMMSATDICRRHCELIIEHSENLKNIVYVDA